MTVSGVGQIWAATILLSGSDHTTLRIHPACLQVLVAALYEEILQVCFFVMKSHGKTRMAAPHKVRIAAAAAASVLSELNSILYFTESRLMNSTADFSLSISSTISPDGSM